MNRRHREDIESFLEICEGKRTTGTGRANKVYKKYEKNLDDVEVWPDIFGELYDGIYVCHMGGTYYTIDGIHDCFPRTSYKSIRNLYETHQKGIKELTLRSVYENFYQIYEALLEDEDSGGDQNATTDEIINDFYNLAFKGGSRDDACLEACDLYDRYYGKNLYDPELWAEIYNQAYGGEEKAIKRDNDTEAYMVFSIWAFPTIEFGSYEEVYRSVLGWEKDTLDFREVYTKFFKHYLDMCEALSHVDEYD